MTMPVTVSHSPSFAAVLFLVVWGWAGGAAQAASSLADYEKRLGEAQQRLREMPEPDPSPIEVIRGLQTVKLLLPANEEIEFEGAKLRVDNSWLHAALDAISEEAAGDVEQRRSKLIELADQVARLRDRLRLPEGAFTGTIETDRRRLEAILGRPEYQPEQLRESSLRRWLRKVADWLKKQLSRLNPGGSEAPSPQVNRGLTILQAILMLGLTAALVYGISRLLQRLRTRTDGEVEETSREVLGETIEEHVVAKDILDRADGAAREGDYRAGIRLAYIALLLNLAERGRLRLDRAKTNRDYLESLRDTGEIFPVFSRLTGVFEQVWYGETPASHEDFQGFLHSYREVASAEVAQTVSLRQ